MHGFGMGQDMAGVMEKFQSCWREGDAVAVPFDQGQGKLFFQILLLHHLLITFFSLLSF